MKKNDIITECSTVKGTVHPTIQILLLFHLSRVSFFCWAQNIMFWRIVLPVAIDFHAMMTMFSFQHHSVYSLSACFNFIMHLDFTRWGSVLNHFSSAWNTLRDFCPDSPPIAQSEQVDASWGKSEPVCRLQLNDYTEHLVVCYGHRLRLF